MRYTFPIRNEKAAIDRHGEGKAAMKKFSTWVFWIIMIGILVALFVLVFDDAAKTGETPSIVGVFSAWTAIVAISCLAWWIRATLVRGGVKLLEEINKRIE